MNWRYFRYAIWPIFLIGGLLLPSGEESLPIRFALENFDGFFRLIFIVMAFSMITVFPYFAFPFVIGMQAVNPFSAEVWDVPSHDKNPFAIRQPLIPFHFISYSIMFFGIGIGVSSIYFGPNIILDGVLFVWGGIHFLGGIRLCQKLYKDKMGTVEQTSSDNQSMAGPSSDI